MLIKCSAKFSGVIVGPIGASVRFFDSMTTGSKERIFWHYTYKKQRRVRVESSYEVENLNSREINVVY